MEWLLQLLKLSKEEGGTGRTFHPQNASPGSFSHHVAHGASVAKDHGVAALSRENQPATGDWINETQSKLH